MSPVSPPVIPPVAPPTAGSAPLQVTVKDPTTQLLRLPLGTRLAATVLGRTPEGTVQVATAAGLLRLPPSPRLPRQGPVTLIVHALAPKLTLQIVPPPASPPSSQSPPVVIGSAAHGTPLPAATVGRQVLATVVKNPEVAPATKTGSAATSALQLRGGQTVPVRIVAVAPAGGQGASARSASAPSPSGTAFLLRGIVAGTSANGQAVVNTTAGVFVLPIAAKPILGAELTLAIGKPPAPAASALPSPVAADGVLRGMAAVWPSLTEALDTLHAVDPRAAQQLGEHILAKPDSGFAAKALFLLSALRGGEIAGWFGQKPLEMLRNANPALAARLADDFRQLGRAFEESSGNDWRTSLIPVGIDGAIEPVRLLLRHHGRDPSSNDKDRREETRFVVDVTLSRLGRLQLDGLVREHGRHMDLIVRTERRLPHPMRDDIRGLFRDAADSVGFTGGLVFQAANGFVDTRSATRTAQGASSVIV